MTTLDHVLWELVTPAERHQLAARAGRVLHWMATKDRSPGDRQSYEAAVGDMLAYCTPQRIYALANQPEPVNHPPWLRRVFHHVRSLERYLSSDLYQRFEVQRETIKRAHFALMSRAGLDWQARSNEVTDGIADAIHFLADQRDTARDRAAHLSAQLYELASRTQTTIEDAELGGKS